jgi:hypothetical protein
MSEAHAQAGGATPAIIQHLYGQPKNAIPQLPPDGSLPPQFATPPPPLSPAEFRSQVTPPAPPGVHASAPPAEPLFPASLTPRPQGLREAPAIDPRAYASSDDPTPAPSIPGQGEPPPDASGLTRINPNMAPQGPPGMNFGTSPGRIVQTSKGGDIRASFTRQPGVALDPAAKAYADSIDPEGLASKRETMTTNAALAADNAIASQISATKEAEAELEAQRAQVAQNRVALQEKLNIVDQREREAATATPQTRREVLQSRGALAGVMSALSIALGGWVQGLRGGENVGLKMLNDSVESEIASQRAKWEAQRDKVGMARTDFGQAMQLYGDPNMAEADMRMRALTLAANMSDAYDKQGKNQEWLANQQQVTQQLQAQAAAEKQKWKTLAEGQVLQENYVYKPPTFAQVGGAPKLTKDQREDQKDARKRIIRLPDGNYAYLSNDSRLKDVQEQLTAGGDVVDGMSKLLALANDNTLTPGAKRDRYKALAQDIRPIISVAKKQGAMGEQEVKGYEDILGDPSAVLRDNGATLKTAIEQQHSRNQRVIRDNAFADPDATTPYSAAAASTFKAGL